MLHEFTTATHGTDYGDRLDKIEMADGFAARSTWTTRQSPAVALPDGFPQTLHSGLAWGPDDIEGREHEFRLQLSEDERREILTACHDVKKSGIATNRLTKATFPLPSLGGKLERINRHVLESPGFFTISGLEPASYTPEENVYVQAGLCCYLGDRRAIQYMAVSGFGPALLHVTDLRNQGNPVSKDDFLMPVHGAQEIKFHQDQGDTLSLYCRQSSADGGELFLSSSWKIYNELAANHPDVIRTLAEPWEWQTESAYERPKTMHEPCIFFEAGRLIMRFMKAPLEGSEDARRDKRLAPLRPEQVHALRVVDALALKYTVTFRLQAGDMIFFNNLALLHARNKFQDGDAQGAKRHLTRMIVRDSQEGWEIPEMLHEHWSRWYDHDPAWEILAEDAQRVWTNQNEGHG
ncbi:hypothetical protein LTR53_005171 [Teratosphaeriaceae sp. CCFEE 6253]|nr:hypothetical protein LTR53_005171 [Teratosphaeriaceae sp. CCFEE 6253]